MGWISITLPANAEQAERLSDALMDVGALSVSIEDSQAGTTHEQAKFGEPGCPTQELWQECAVVCLFPDTVNPIPSLHDLLLEAASQSDYPLAGYTQAFVAEQDWVRATQAQFLPIPIANRLWIVPSWHQSPDPSAISIQLDPGLAFGTGSHPTTHLCLEWLVYHLPVDASVLDYGCGSGILAIAAAKLGARHVLGIDIDPQAVITARENAQRNQQNDYVLCNTLIHETTAKLAHDQSASQVAFITPESDPSAHYDVVIANILTNPLRTLAPLLASRCRQGGQLVLSGILAPQAELVQAAYAEWFDLNIYRELEGWVCLNGVKRM